MTRILWRVTTRWAPHTHEWETVEWSDTTERQPDEWGVTVRIRLWPFRRWLAWKYYHVTDYSKYVPPPPYDQIEKLRKRVKKLERAQR